MQARHRLRQKYQKRTGASMRGRQQARHPLMRHQLPRHQLLRHQLPRHQLPRHQLPRHQLPHHRCASCVIVVRQQQPTAAVTVHLLLGPSAPGTPRAHPLASHTPCLWATSARCLARATALCKSCRYVWTSPCPWSYAQTDRPLSSSLLSISANMAGTSFRPSVGQGSHAGPRQTSSSF